MKTAVEYLYTQLQMNNEILIKGTRVHQEMEEKIFDQAKEIEKQQMNKCYSEEEVIDLLQKMNDWPTICEGRSDIEEWFEQFKKNKI
jgi:hypothetical protein